MKLLWGLIQSIGGGGKRADLVKADMQQNRIRLQEQNRYISLLSFYSISVNSWLSRVDFNWKSKHLITYKKAHVANTIAIKIS